MLDMMSKEQDFINNKLIGRTIEVTQQDIQDGNTTGNDTCAIALGAKRALNADGLSVGATGIFLRYNNPHGNLMRITILMSDVIQDWIVNFDRGNEVKPIEIGLKPLKHSHPLHDLETDILK